MALFKILKGLKSNLEAQPKKEGYAWYTTDDSKLYIDVSEDERQPLNSYYADKLKGVLPDVPETPVAADEYIPYTWEEINAIALSGHAEDWISVGALKSETLTETVLYTTTHDIRVIGINEDNNASITFQTRNCLGGTTIFGSSALWSSSTIRDYCQDYYNAFLGKDYIKTLRKGTNTVYNSASLVYTDETVWIPSVYEMGGYESYSYVPVVGEYTEGVSSTYSYYSSNASRIKKLGDSGDTYYYWTRSRSTKGDVRACFIASGGNASGHQISTKRGIAPAFTIGNGVSVPDLSAEDVVKLVKSANSYTDNQIAAIPAPDISGEIAKHNVNGEAHSDIRDAISNISIIKETNNNEPQRFWRGTKEEFDAVETKADDTLYIVTDDDTTDIDISQLYLWKKSIPSINAKGNGTIYSGVLDSNDADANDYINYSNSISIENDEIILDNPIMNVEPLWIQSETSSGNDIYFTCEEKYPNTILYVPAEQAESVYEGMTTISFNYYIPTLDYNNEEYEYITSEKEDAYDYTLLGQIGELIDSSSNGYTKEQILSSTTAAQFGLDETSVPDDVLAHLGQYNQHWWSLKHFATITAYRKITTEISEKYSASASTCSLGLDAQTGTLYVSSSIVFNSDTGEVQLVSPTIYAPGDPLVDIKSFAGKYIKGTDGKVFLYRSASESTTIDDVVKISSISGGSYNYTGVSYLTFISNMYVVCSEAYEIDTGTITYAHSSDRNAYPDSGTVDDIAYTYLGIPFENAVTAPRVEAGSYVGTGTYGSDNPNSLTFDFKPKFIMIPCSHYVSGSVNSANIHDDDGVMICPPMLTTDWLLNANLWMSSAGGYGKVSDDGKTYYWYTTGKSALYQLNETTRTYYYIAIG